MKILDVCEFYAPNGGGVRNYIEQKFDAAARHGHRLTVLAPGAETKTELRGPGKLIWVKSPTLPVDKNYRMFWRAADVWPVIDQESPDLVIGSSPWRGGWLVANWPGHAAKVLFMHSDPVAVYPQNWFGAKLGRDRTDRAFGWFWSYLRRLNSSFDATIVTGAWLSRRFSQFGLRNIEVAPFGIDRAAFAPQNRNEALRRTWLERCGLAENAALLVAVGRHHPEKRLDLLIAAVRRAQATKPVGLIILGDGLIRSAVERWASKVPHVVVAGQISDRALLASTVASADALLHGSSCETFGFAVAEALCSGTPVIVPDSGGAAAFADAAYAETYRAGDRKDAAAAILRMLARDRAEISSAAIEASNRLVGTVDGHFERLFGLYEALIARERLPAIAAA